MPILLWTKVGAACRGRVGLLSFTHTLNTEKWIFSLGKENMRRCNSSLNKNESKLSKVFLRRGIFSFHKTWELCCGAEAPTWFGISMWFHRPKHLRILECLQLCNRNGFNSAVLYSPWPCGYELAGCNSVESVMRKGTQGYTTGWLDEVRPWLHAE